jgi:hypothetical protein
MANELKQLEPLRRQVAKIKSYLINLTNVPNLSPKQYAASELVRITFNQMVIAKMPAKRQQFGDKKPGKFDLKLDGYNNTLDIPRTASVIINELSKELRELKRLAEFVCNANNDPLLLNIKDYMSFDYANLKINF